MPPEEVRLPDGGRGHRRFSPVDILLVASLAGPLAIFSTAAVLDRRQTLASVERDLLSTLDTLHGHAANLLQFQEMALGAAEELLRGVPDAEIRADPHRHHLRHRALSERSGRSVGLVVFGADGRPLVESDRSEPPRGIDVSDRDRLSASTLTEVS